MSFDRNQLPDALTYFENQGLTLSGPSGAKWKTTTCNFHGGSDSMRVNMASGAWVCMSCDVKGGDVLSYEMLANSSEFIDAAKALGCWIDDGRAPVTTKPTPISARQALSVLAFESTLVAVAAGNIAHGIALTDTDRVRVMTSAIRINRLVEAFA